MDSPSSSSPKSLPPSPPSTPKLERLSSFDLDEPKTLFDNVIDAARQAALEIIRNHSKEEAMKIFMGEKEPAAKDDKATKAAPAPDVVAVPPAPDAEEESEAAAEWELEGADKLEMEESEWGALTFEFDDDDVEMNNAK